MNSMPATLSGWARNFGMPDSVFAARVTLRTCLKHHYLRFAELGS